jgi:hypothetical protein
MGLGVLLYGRGRLDVLTVQSPRGHIARFGAGELQRKHRVPSDSLIADTEDVDGHGTRPVS